MDSVVLEGSGGINDVQEVISRRMFPFEVTSVGACRGTAAEISHANIGAAEFTRIYSHMAFAGQRRRLQVGERGGYSVVLIEDGSLIEFGGSRNGRLRPGDLYLVGAHHYPFETERKSAGSSLAVRLPYSLVTTRFPRIDDWCQRPVDTSIGAALILRRAMHTMWTERGALARSAAPALVEALLHLVEATFTERHAPIPTHSGSSELHMLRLQAVVDANLANPRLDSDFVSAELGISRSYLYKLLAEAGVTLGGLIMGGRLERARDMLHCASQAHRTIAEIAAAVGFADAAHFSRRFSARFGKSPRAYRGAALEHRRRLGISRLEQGLRGFAGEAVPAASVLRPAIGARFDPSEPGGRGAP